MKLHIIFRFTDEGIAARSVDFPELDVAGRTIAEAEGKMVNAIEKHVKELQAQKQWRELFETTPSATDVYRDSERH